MKITDIQTFLMLGRHARSEALGADTPFGSHVDPRDGAARATGCS